MASAKSYTTMRRAAATNYRFLSTDTTAVAPAHGRTNSVEFDESDIWGGLSRSNSTEFRTPPPMARSASRNAIAVLGKCEAARSVPVNVPDWSTILREEYKDKWTTEANYSSGGGYDGGDEEWVPPHEYLARTRNASFSVQEGIGRTLKGRDLSRVRNAIWEKTGFQD